MSTVPVMGHFYGVGAAQPGQTVEDQRTEARAEHVGDDRGNADDHLRRNANSGEDYRPRDRQLDREENASTG